MLKTKKNWNISIRGINGDKRIEEVIEAVFAKDAAKQFIDKHFPNVVMFIPGYWINGYYCFELEGMPQKLYVTRI